MSDSDQYPSCFGDLDTVFPVGGQGLRQSPQTCMRCAVKTECLRTALDRPNAIALREEMIDRAYHGGVIGVFQRWSRKKIVYRMKQRAVEESRSQNSKPAKG